MEADPKRPHPRHVSLAQKILDFAVERGMTPGDRMAEQGLADHCRVSRTPIRKALQVLAERGLISAEPEGGYVLASDPALVARIEQDQGQDDDSDIHGAILRDLAAGRISQNQTVAALQRRYGAPRQSVQNALIRLSEDNLAERAPGQQWLLKQFAISADATAKSFEFRLAMEPLALTFPDFRRDVTAIASLRQSMMMLRAMGESSFDRKLFERTDFDFHMLVAKGCGNPFLAEALTNHHRRRRATAQPASIGTYRLMQSNAEHIQILDQIERGQMELAVDLMRVHIQLSRTQRPSLAGRGVPALFRIA